MAPRHAGSAAVAAAIAERSGDLERIALKRIASIGPEAPADLPYGEGRKEAISAGIHFGIALIGRGEQPDIPAALLSQARAAAAGEVCLDVLLRRCFAGYAAFSECLIEVSAASKQPTDVNALLGLAAAGFDQMTAAMSEAYSRQIAGGAGNVEHRRLHAVIQILAGQPGDLSEFGYRLDLFHLGVAVPSRSGAATVHQVARDLDAILLIAEPAGPTTWGWLGFAHRPARSDLRKVAEGSLTEFDFLACGELKEGVAGWRASHRQALAAQPLAKERPGEPTWYGDMALAAAATGNDLLLTFLKEDYLERLSTGPDNGTELKRTLRIYLSTGLNGASAAAALGVSRQTVAKRLRSAESLLERSIANCASSLDTALRLECQAGKHPASKTG